MSDGLQAIGWLIAGVGMVIHVIGVVLGVWAFDFMITWSVPLVGFVLMMLGGVVNSPNA